MCSSDLHGKVLSDAMGEVTRGLEVIEFACGIPTLLKGEFSEQAIGVLREVPERGADRDQQQPQLLRVPARLLGGPDVRLGHDLHQRRPGAIEVDEADPSPIGRGGGIVLPRSEPSYAFDAVLLSPPRAHRLRRDRPEALEHGHRG